MSYVLVVEDNQDLAMTVCELIESKRQIAALCSNGREALELLNKRAEVPLLVLTNWDMPIMNGHAFVQYLQAHDRFQNVPIVIVSGTNVRAPQGVRVVSKPYKQEQILALMGQFCSRKQ